MNKFFAIAAIAMMCAAPAAAESVKTQPEKQATEVAEVSEVHDVQCNAHNCCGWVSILGDGVRIRTAPNLNSKVIGKENWYYKYKKWHEFACLGVVNGFYKIRYNGRVAYVSCQFASHEPCD